MVCILIEAIVCFFLITWNWCVTISEVWAVTQDKNSPAQEIISNRSKNDVKASDTEVVKSSQGSAPAKGFIRVGPTKRYFQFEDGSPFFPIGHNEWGDRFMVPPYSLENIDRYFKNMHEHGENLLRIIVDSHNLPVEKPAGHFNPAFKSYMHNLVTLAEKYDIYLMVAMWPDVWNVPSPFAFGASWKDHPYCKKNGGPVEKYEDFFTAPEAMRLQEARVKFFIDNWGRSDHIFAWELANEFNYNNNAWIDLMAKYCRSYELSKYGKTHMRCVSVSSSDFGSPGSAQWSNPDLDFATFHTYGKKDLLHAKGSGRDKLISQTLMAPQIVERVLKKSRDRPIVDSEMPGIVRGKIKVIVGLFANDEVIEESFLTVGFAYICAGAASSGLRWASNPSFRVNGSPNALGMSLYNYQLAMRRFVDQVDWNKIDPIRYDEIKIQSSNKKVLKVISTVSKDRRYVIGWVLDRLAATNPTQVTALFSDLTNEAHLLRWVEDTTGNVLKAETIEGAAFSVTSPPFLGHVAFYIEPSKSDI